MARIPVPGGQNGHSWSLTFHHHHDTDSQTYPTAKMQVARVSTERHIDKSVSLVVGRMNNRVELFELFHQFGIGQRYIAPNLGENLDRFLSSTLSHEPSRGFRQEPHCAK